MHPKPVLLPAIAAIALAACATAPVGKPVVTSGPPTASGVPAASAPAPAVCRECGTIVHIETIAAGKASTVGGIVGGVAGKPVAGELDYNVHLRMDDGRRESVRQDELGSLRVDSRVRLVGGKLISP